ncbi:MAG: fibronectin type III domain-containing protein, partial [Actinomycetota bacterium]
ASDFNEFASSVTFSTAPAGTPSATFTGLSGLTNYFFRVAAVNNNGLASAFVNLGSVVTNLNALPAPVIGGISQVNVSSITASWSLVAGATGYTLVASALPANPPVSIAASTTPVGEVVSATALAPALNPNTTYYLFVRANGDQVSSPYTAYPATSTLANIPATAVSTFSGVSVTSISVNWSANGNPLSITTYTVQLSTASDFNTFATSMTFSTAPAGAPSAAFTGLTGGTTYYFRVRALNNNGLLTAFVSLGSTATMPTPLFSMITNAQTGDAAWRRSNTGLYNVSFLDASGFHLDKFQVKASTTAAGQGSDLIGFTDTVTGLSPSDTYNTPWPLPAAVFDAMIEGVTNYVSVRVINGLGNATTLQDAFYVQKDTTAPNMVNGQAGDSTVRAAAGTTYDVKAFDSSSGLAAFQYSASLTPATGNAALITWTDIAAVANSTS